MRRKPLAGAAVTVINPGLTALCSGMLPGFVAGHYLRETLDIDIARLCEEVGALRRWARGGHGPTVETKHEDMSNA